MNQSSIVSQHHICLISKQFNVVANSPANPNLLMSRLKNNLPFLWARGHLHRNLESTLSFFKKSGHPAFNSILTERGTSLYMNISRSLVLDPCKIQETQVPQGKKFTRNFCIKTLHFSKIYAVSVQNFNSSIYITDRLNKIKFYRIRFSGWLY